jgi:hypothetical protein
LPKKAKQKDGWCNASQVSKAGKVYASSGKQPKVCKKSRRANVTVGKEFTKSGGGMKKMNPGMMAMMKKKSPSKEDVFRWSSCWSQVG